MTPVNKLKISILTHCLIGHDKFQRKYLTISDVGEEVHLVANRPQVVAFQCANLNTLSFTYFILFGWSIRNSSSSMLQIQLEVGMLSDTN